MLERDSPWRTLRGEMGPIDFRGEMRRTPSRFNFDALILLLWNDDLAASDWFRIDFSEPGDPLVVMIEDI